MKLTEKQLRKIIRESIKRTVTENMLWDGASLFDYLQAIEHIACEIMEAPEQDAEDLDYEKMVQFYNFCKKFIELYDEEKMSSGSGSLNEYEYNLATKRGQEAYMWNKYGNRSVVPSAGIEHEDDAYTRSDMDSGELAMQVMGFDSPIDPLWAKNGKDPKWRSPKGDFRTRK